MKNSFLSENFQFLEVKIYLYLNRCVFVMKLNSSAFLISRISLKCNNLHCSRLNVFFGFSIIKYILCIRITFEKHAYSNI